MKTLSIIVLILACAPLGVQSAESDGLPSPAEFDPSRYLGKWYEVARVPTPVQPEGSLATAEYSASGEDGVIIVKNTAFDAQGEIIDEIAGKARIAEGETKGRLTVSFGPGFPDEPNYCVLRIDKNYKLALVGSPSRNSLRILARNVSVPEKRLRRLTKVAEAAGYDTSKLVFAKWPDEFSAAGEAGRDAGSSKVAGNWAFNIKGPNGEQVNLPMDLRVEGNALGGKVGRPDGRVMELKDGKVDGDAFTFTLERDRPGGGTMTYKLTGKYANDELSGEARTEINGEEVTSAWRAVRVKGESE